MHVIGSWNMFIPFALLGAGVWTVMDDISEVFVATVRVMLLCVGRWRIAFTGLFVAFMRKREWAEMIKRYNETGVTVKLAAVICLQGPFLKLASVYIQCSSPKHFVCVLEVLTCWMHFLPHKNICKATVCLFFFLHPCFSFLAFLSCCMWEQLRVTLSCWPLGNVENCFYFVLQNSPVH